MINDKKVVAEIKAMAAQKLETLTHTPDGQVKLRHDYSCTAEFCNGFQRPNNHPPKTVYVVINGIRYRRQVGGKWSKY